MSGVLFRREERASRRCKIPIPRSRWPPRSTIWISYRPTGGSRSCGWQNVQAWACSRSSLPLGSYGGALFADPTTNYDLHFVPQGISADLIATLEGFTRDDVDAYAVRSQERAEAAWSRGHFAKSVVPVKDLNGVTVLDVDEHRRPGTTLEGLAALKPSFAGLGEAAGFDAVAMQKYTSLEKINHVHHGGNSSGIVDGAALLLIGNEQMGRQFGMAPRARIIATAVTGSDPTVMLTGPTQLKKR